jgi:hypothetical protein
LGIFSHFLQTVIHSQQRRETSALLGSFLKLIADWTGSNWLLDPKGLHGALVLLTTSFRNRAAHIDELGKHDYDGCRKLVLGSDGVLWRLALATERNAVRGGAARRWSPLATGPPSLRRGPG